jgi:putative ABC transport system permease protein
MSALSDFVERVRALVFRRREEREMQEELRFHLDMETEQNARRGMPADAARRAGRIALGGVERTKEDVRDARGTRLLEDTAGDFAFTWRTLARNPGFALVAILTLAIGIGGTTAVYSAVDAVLLQPLPYQESGQLVRLYQHYKGDPDGRNFVTAVHYLDFRSRVSSFDAVGAEQTYSEKGADIGTGGGVRRIHVLEVSADYFDVVRVRPALGGPFRREDETGAPVVVLSNTLWKEQFQSDPSAVGKTLVMSGVAYTITGVMPAGYTDPLVRQVDAWVPINLTEGKDITEADNHWISVIARLRPGVSVARAQSELDIVGETQAQLYPAGKNNRARIYPLKEDIVGSSSRALEVMLGAVALVLVLVCVNIANLLLVRGSERAREFAIRAALGAPRVRLVRQLLIESLTLAIAGEIVALIVARLAMTAIVALGAGSLPRLASLTLEPRLLVFSLVIATLCAVGFGLAPALRAARAQPGDALSDQGRSGTSGRTQVRMREWLVASQVALAFVLLVGAGLLLASVRQIGQVNLGVKPAGALVFEVALPPARYDSTARARFYEEYARKLEALPGVTAAGGVSKLPATGNYHSWGVLVLSGPLVGKKEGDDQAQNRVISGDYLKAAGIPVVEGRAFDARDDNAAPSRVLVSESLAKRMYPGISALGQRLNCGGHDSEIIGVVGDIATDAEGRGGVYIYRAHTQFAGDRVWSLTQVVRTTGSTDAIEIQARHLLAEMDPQLVMYRPATFADAIGRGEAQRTFTLRILATFALVALALSALGLFGVLSYGVRLRSREFGIRMALGAEAGAIRGMVLRRGLIVTAIGTVAGLIGALALSRLMASIVFQVSPFDPIVLAGAALFMLVVSSIAAYLPARRATIVDPRSALQ